MLRTSKDSPPAGLPHSEESERAVLATLLLDPQSIAMVRGELEAEDFYLERHQVIYQSMLELADAQTAIDLRTLQARLEMKGAFELVGGFAYLAGIDLDLPDLGRRDLYVEIVKERSTRRQLVLHCSEVVSACLDSGMNAEEGLASAAEGISALQAVGQNGHGPKSIEDYCHEFDRWEPLPPGKLLGLPTGLSDLDRSVLGMESGCQYVLAGRPGMGKSSFAAGISVAAARAGASVLVMSLEMPGGQWRDRILAQESAAGGQPGIALRRIRTGQIGNAQSASMQHFVTTMRSVSALPIFIDERRGLTVDQIAATAAMFKMENGLDLLIVDHLGKITYRGSHKNKVNQVGEICGRLRNLGAVNELDIPILTLAQLNREVEKRSPPRPKIADLRDSGEIEQDADGIWFLYRPIVYDLDAGDKHLEPLTPEHNAAAGYAEVIVAKQRQGETGRIPVAWVGDVTGFRDLARQQEPEGRQRGW